MIIGGPPAKASRRFVLTEARITTIPATPCSRISPTTPSISEPRAFRPGERASGSPPTRTERPWATIQETFGGPSAMTLTGGSSTLHTTGESRRSADGIGMIGVEARSASSSFPTPTHAGSSVGHTIGFRDPQQDAWLVR